MDDQQNYYKDAVQRVLELLQATFGAPGSGFFKVYYKGVPDQTPPEGAYPCIMVQQLTHQSAVGATMTDDVNEEIIIHVLSNRKDYAGTPEIVDTAMNELKEMVIGQDPSTGFYKSDTLLYALRTNFTLGQYVLNGSIAVNFSSTYRPQIAAICEADIKLSYYRRVIVPGRS